MFYFVLCTLYFVLKLSFFVCTKCFKHTLVWMGTLPPPSLASECAPPPGTGGGDILACWWGVGRVPIPTTGDKLITLPPLWFKGSKYIRKLAIRTVGSVCFGPPGSGSYSKRYASGFGPGSNHHLAKIVRKKLELISTVLWILYDFYLWRMM